MCVCSSWCKDVRRGAREVFVCTPPPPTAHTRTEMYFIPLSLSHTHTNIVLSISINRYVYLYRYITGSLWERDKLYNFLYV